jgi:outer membrane lipoprotein-sorting protein
MKLRSPVLPVCLLLAAVLVCPGVAGDNVQEVLNRMDKAAAAFKAMTSSVAYLTHTDVLNDNTTETGTLTMKKVRAGEVQGKVEFTAPDRKTVTIEKRRVQEYLPKINTLQIFDLNKHGVQLDQFFMIGFGTSGTELAKNFDVTVLGAGDVNGKPAIHLQLIPKNAEVKQYVQKVELWIPQQGDPYPLQEKTLEPSGDYHLITYNDLKINPALKPDALELNPPKDVKVEYPGK